MLTLLRLPLFPVSRPANGSADAFADTLLFLFQLKSYGAPPLARARVKCRLVRHTDYISAWLDVLREDNRAIVRAASQASKAADYLLGLVSETAPGAAKKAIMGDHEAA